MGGGDQGSVGSGASRRVHGERLASIGGADSSSPSQKAFTDTISGDWGGKPFEDLMKGLDHALATYPWLDGDRVAALGASYGGWMIN